MPTSVSPRSSITGQAWASSARATVSTTRVLEVGSGSECERVARA